MIFCLTQPCIFGIIYIGFVYSVFIFTKLMLFEGSNVMKRAMTEIAGNRELCKRLASDIASGALSHAYILEGATGSGRKTIALNVAAATACENRFDSTQPLPCLCCSSCKKILGKKSTDVIFVRDESKSTVGVDIARFLKEDVRIVPNDIEDKFYIIENADKMTTQAQNALLLTLEEPPSFAHFFLICNNDDALLETIRSRAITLRTQRLSDKEIEDYVCAHDTRAAQMRFTSPNEFKELIKASRGGIGKALEYLEPKAFKEIKAQRDFIRSFIFEAISRRRAESIIPMLSKFSSKRDILTDELLLLALAVRDLIVLKKSDSSSLEFYCEPNEAIELSDKVSLSFLYTLYKNIDIAIEENKRNANVRIMIMKLAVNSSII